MVIIWAYYCPIMPKMFYIIWFWSVWNACPISKRIKQFIQEQRYVNTEEGGRGFFFGSHLYFLSHLPEKLFQPWHWHWYWHWHFEEEKKCLLVRNGKHWPQKKVTDIIVTPFNPIIYNVYSLFRFFSKWLKRLVGMPILDWMTIIPWQP